MKARPPLEVDAQWMHKQGDKDYILYGGLLHNAHQQGLTETEVKVLQFPTETNGHTCVVHCKATFVDDAGPRYFEEIGDASPQNCNRNVAPHLIRMASTRAKARCFRDALNYGGVAWDEIGGGEEDATDPNAGKARGQFASKTASAKSAPRPAANAAARPAPTNRPAAPAKPADPAQQQATEKDWARYRLWLREAEQVGQPVPPLPPESTRAQLQEQVGWMKRHGVPEPPRDA